MLRPGDARLPDYGRDESHCGSYPPDCAVLAETADEVALVLRLAREHRVPVTPRGAGSGKTGGALPVRGGVVLSTERLTATREIDADDLVAVVEPGVITGDLQAAADEHGLFYPPDPASLAYCSIGGNVACNAGGPRAFKYGVTREYVLGLEVVLMGGERLRVGRRTSKGVTGYDLVAGFVGSEGTFGVITEAVVKLVPRPPAVSTLLAVFADVHRAGAAASALLGAGLRPRTIEIADRTCIDHVRAASRFPFPAGAGAIALVELDGDAYGLEAATLRAGQLCEASGATDVVIAQSESDRRDMWNARRIISSSLRAAHPAKVSEDICVPRGAIGEMLRRIDVIAGELAVPMASYGHAGDGNLHVNLLFEDSARANMEPALAALFRDTVELGGTLSGEHGIGLAKREYMPLEQSARVIEWQRRWKRMWDPEELLNPGKVLPAHRLCHE